MKGRTFGRKDYRSKGRLKEGFMEGRTYGRKDLWNEERIAGETYGRNDLQKIKLM